MLVEGFDERPTGLTVLKTGTMENWDGRTTGLSVLKMGSMERWDERTTGFKCREDGCCHDVALFGYSKPHPPLPASYNSAAVVREVVNSWKRLSPHGHSIVTE